MLSHDRERETTTSPNNLNYEEFGGYLVGETTRSPKNLNYEELGGYLVRGMNGGLG